MCDGPVRDMWLFLPAPPRPHTFPPASHWQWHCTQVTAQSAVTAMVYRRNLFIYRCVWFDQVCVTGRCEVTCHRIQQFHWAIDLLYSLQYPTADFRQGHSNSETP